MAKHRAKRYGICHGVNLASFFIPIPEIPEITTGYWFVDLGIRIGITHLIGFGIARIASWDNEE